MDKITGTWHNNVGQTITWSKDGNYSAHVPGASELSGRYVFQDGCYVMESGGVIISAFRILSYDESTMKCGLHNGEIHICKRVGNDNGTQNNNGWLSEGKTVIIHGLKTNALLNNTNGVIKRFDKASSRYCVFSNQKKVEIMLQKKNLKQPSAQIPPSARSGSFNPFSVQVNNDPLAQFTESLNQQTAQLEQQNNQYLQQLNQYTAIQNKESEQILQQLNQNTAIQNKQNEQMLQQLNQNAAMQNNETAQMMQQMLGGGFANNMYGFQPETNFVGSQTQTNYANGSQPQTNFANGSQPQTNSGGSQPQTNKIAGKVGKFWNSFINNVEDPAASGEFVGAAAGEFAQGVGFDLSGFSMGALFG